MPRHSIVTVLRWPPGRTDATRYSAAFAARQLAYLNSFGHVRRRDPTWRLHSPALRCGDGVNATLSARMPGMSRAPMRRWRR